MNKKNIELSQWSIEHPRKWEIICGTTETGPQNNYKIMLLLENAGFQELSYMILCRLHCLLNDENKIEIE
ncbi:hypothetical protein IR152_18470 [Clostridioides sp. ES-S-0108-01]|uniref:hypothetical protein n=1 Tax=unclassified Clostridioides TaxID=2635829 RepID=UPI001D0CB3A3|nr:hypothetical protein [Clostridioides sp. ES-S-0107-01]MCC0784995.1 hypothetical protein [Clostridioides sp. ES-S-0108-01]UDN52982.1 hypothetical protein JJC16_18655 [Clostridioides sp. ES-S-0107-01]